MGRRGYTTRPRRRKYGPVPFSVRRVQRITQNPFYAGLQRFQGETIPGDWPTYIEPEDFYRLLNERRRPRERGRPPQAHLLSGLTWCGHCTGPVYCVSAPRARKHGTRARRCVCENHRARQPDDPHWCFQEPLDAVMVDRLVLEGLEKLLTQTDIEDLRESLLAGQRAEHARLDGIVTDAKRDLDAAERAADRAETAYADALADDDGDAAEIAMSAAKRKRAEAKAAETRLDAALDAREHEPPADAGEAIAQLVESLGTRVAEAAGDVKAINAALREGLECVWVSDLGIIPVPNNDELHRAITGPSKRGALRIEPVVWED